MSEDITDGIDVSRLPRSILEMIRRVANRQEQRFDEMNRLIDEEQAKRKQLEGELQSTRTMMDRDKDTVKKARMILELAGSDKLIRASDELRAAIERIERQESQLHSEIAKVQALRMQLSAVTKQGS